MNRYVARLIACLMLSFGFWLLVLLMPTGGAKSVEVRTDGPTADIVAAIEALRRNDVSVRVSPQYLAENPLAVSAIGALFMAAMLWLAAGCVRRIEAKILQLAEKKPR